MMLAQILTIGIWTGAGMMAGGAVILVVALAVTCICQSCGWQPEWFE
jgi:hypothetical protein